ncbi:MAG: hypothetical protein A2Z11_00055 [Candidatus Woykebacteria bacterium RBG_16_43_9]|uniref:LTD domain-containing protein n=1 Tax=Candidatus Woykebacteria bacterium RBG_16_43_9 TaxID=1802596 RepID=A0A1G1WC15_9BACT|nr:MAG: hypothetical protein A2Z11_00055 [Candidatus Woykebacteria bacterium RBG_16_43_9]
MAVLLFIYTATTSSFAASLLDNPSFEEPISSGWKTYAVSAAQSSEYKQSGNFSAKVKSTTTNSGSKYLYQIVPVAPEKTYSFSGFALKKGEPATTVYLSISFYESIDGSGSQIDGKSYRSNELKQDSSEFALLETDIIKAPENAKTAKLRLTIQMPTGATQVGIAYFDELAFTEVSSPSPTSPQPIIPPTSQQVITSYPTLSEIFPNPTKGGKEWVELYNPNSSTVDLTGWKLVDAANHSKTLSGSVAAKSYKVFEYSSGWLNNGGDILSLVNPSGKLAEKYSFGSSERGEAFAKDATGKWRTTTTPTPGKPNKITGAGGFVGSSNSETAQNTTGTLSSTGLDPTADYLGDTFQFSDPNEQPISPTKSKVAGVNERKGGSSSLPTLLISVGIAFIGTAVAWPYLERRKIV